MYLTDPKQEFEAAVGLKLDKLWEDFKAMSRQLRAEDDKRQFQTKMREVNKLYVLNITPFPPSFPSSFTSLFDLTTSLL